MSRNFARKHEVRRSRVNAADISRRKRYAVEIAASMHRWLTLLIFGIALGQMGGARADQLIFKDGDRVQGTFVRRENGKIVFQSTRFGDLSVNESEATVEITSQPPPPIVAPMPTEERQPVSDDELLTRWRRKMEQGIVRWWEPWNGRIAVSTDVVHDSQERTVFLAEGRLRRTWAQDEVQQELRYEYREEEERTTVDMLKGTGSWRHDWRGNRYFTLYRATFERDKVNSGSFQPFPYLLLHQQLGAGVILIKKPRVQIRVGVAENFFNVWSLDTDEKSSEHVEAAFLESEFHLPWRVSITERGMWYYSIKESTQGWENQFELSKKLTDSLSLGVRHELRKNNPDSRVQDYERLRFLIGYDF